MRYSKLLFTLCLLAVGKSAIAASNYDTQINTVYDLLNYQSKSKWMGDKGRNKLAEQTLRMQMLEDYAKQSAMRAAMIATNKQINNLIQLDSRELDAIYNFSPLMLYGRVVPPVISEANDLYNQKGSDQIRLSKKIYKIEKQATFSSTPPNWRSYLKVNYEADAFDNIAYIGGDLSPRNSEEMAAWERATHIGWQMGVNQANIALQQKLERLNRDYIGMIRFHQMAMQGQITIPVISNHNLFDSNTGQQWILDEQLLRLETLPEFKKVGGTQYLRSVDGVLLNEPMTDIQSEPAAQQPQSSTIYKSNFQEPGWQTTKNIDPDSNNILQPLPIDSNKNNRSIPPLNTIDMDIGQTPIATSSSISSNVPVNSQKFTTVNAPNYYQATQPQTYYGAPNNSGLVYTMGGSPTVNPGYNQTISDSRVENPNVPLDNKRNHANSKVYDNLQKIVNGEQLEKSPSLSPLDYTTDPLTTKREVSKNLTIEMTTTYKPVQVNTSGENNLVKNETTVATDASAKSTISQIKSDKSAAVVPVEAK